MTDIQLLQPEWLWLAPLLLMVPWLIRRGHLQSAGLQKSATPVKHPLANAISDNTRHHAFPGDLLVVVCGLLMLCALAQPVKPGSRLPDPPAPVDLMLIIDTSISMVLKDYRLDGKSVDRMTMTQVLLDRFSRRYSGKRISIVVLGDKPHMLLKPSEDIGLVRHLINRLQPTIAGRQAALGDAVAVAAEYIKSNQENLHETTMVLISDGVLPSGNLSPLEGARRAAESKAVLHTIAIGASSMQQESKSGLIYEPADTQLLQQMATIGGGKSFHAIDTAAMDSALMEIEKSRQTAAVAHPSPQLQEALYYWPLGLAVILLMAINILPYVNFGTARQ